MIDRLAEWINHLAATFPNSSVLLEFVSRAKKGQLTRDENPTTHFCVYFAAFDQKKEKVFIGHHKKSGLWIFNGGHIDKGETPEEALSREIGEEWGLEIDLKRIGEPKLFTITPIHNPTKQKCTKHYDIWYFVPVSQATFTPSKKNLDTEFYTTGWYSIKDSRVMITDPNTLIALSEFERSFNHKVA